ncbi:hypothetical protein [Deinococcus arenicola]|uniref:Uncharacterized protein n=1 Tax=Deinococcus arenicola TaxID=2994950 RepID=A0ABU4DVA5_9DEIO|nr:hypothetical protein [Deinococcus sp. ZS9-10]MDV6376374.1 hypothetical protein [Deinococcus sp. ZS9-10]
MARSYDPALLTALDPTSLDWSRTWVRTLLRDRPEIDRGGLPLAPGQPSRPREATWPALSRDDTEINAALALDAVRSPTVTYYRPHVTAARLYLGDPALWRSRSVDGASESRRDAKEITAAWLVQGRAIDALIPPELLPVQHSASASTRVLRRPSIVVRPEEQGW